MKHLLKLKYFLFLVFFSQIITGCNYKINNKPRTNIIYNDSETLISFHTEKNIGYLKEKQKNLAKLLFFGCSELAVSGAGVKLIRIVENEFRMEITPLKENLNPENRLPIKVYFIKDEKKMTAEYSIKVKLN